MRRLGTRTAQARFVPRFARARETDRHCSEGGPVPAGLGSVRCGSKISLIHSYFNRGDGEAAAEARTSAVAVGARDRELYDALSRPCVETRS